MIDFTGKTVLVTGSSRGVGLGIARGFHAGGATLHMLADDPAVMAVAADLGATGYVADIRDEAQVIAALLAIPSLDVLINNAGYERLTPLDDPSDACLQTFQAIIDINVKGTFIVTRAAMPKLTKGSAIVNTASVWARTASPLFGAYVASKHAVIGLTKTWAKELGPRGIRVNAVCPGWVKTEASLRSLARMAEIEGRPETALLGEILATQALPGLMEIDDIAGPYLYLASTLAANVTGQSLGIDRGEAPW